MTSWPAKDADAVLDYGYTIPLESGDSVASYTFTKLSGDVVIDSQGIVGARVLVWLSGGTDGEINTFRIAWVTTEGRENDDEITLAIAPNSGLDLGTEYANASASTLKAAFAKFASVSDATVEFWLERARRLVDQSWTEGDYAMGQMLLACHYMTREGLGTGTEAQIAAEGLGEFTSVKSGQFSFTRKENSGDGSADAGSMSATSYGRQWLTLCRINRGGARITPTGSVPDASLYPSGI
jgi:Protein of unknown function (DUF4054)